MTGEKFKKLCKKYDISVGELPAFPPKTFFDDEVKLEEFLKNLSEAKRNGTNN